MSQKITYTKIENFKGIKELEAQGFSRFVGIIGKNGAGKSSFIEAITNAIKLTRGGNDKVREGEDKGLIEVHFEDFKIKRIVGKDGKLIVEHNGEIVSSPQTWLDEIFKGSIGDPQKFLNLHNKEKVRYILSTHGMIEEFDSLESERDSLSKERQEKHRTVLAKEEEVDKFDTSIFSSIVGDVNDTTSITEELREAEEHNKKYYSLKEEYDLKESEYSIIKKQKSENEEKILEIKEKIRILQLDLEKRQEDLVKNAIDEKNASIEMNAAKEKLDKFKPIDTSEIRGKLSEVTEKQQQIANIRAKKELYEENKAKAIELRSERKELDKAVKEVELEQNKLIEGIPLSYPMKLEDGIMSVEVDGKRIPLDDLNTAAQLELGVEICLSGPNKVKILTIENANALDPNSMEKIKKKIEEAEAQCFLETVYQTGYEEIVIENGTIKK